MAWNYSPDRFTLPPKLTPEQQVNYCIKIIISLKKQIKPQNQLTSRLLKQQKDWREKAEYWKDKYRQQKQQISTFIKETEKLKKEQEKLRQKIEKLTKTNSRYQVSLFDHGNFKRRGENGDKKPKGGQLGHIDTNRENQAGFDLSQFKTARIYAKCCGSCGQDLNRVSSTRRKLFLDIKVNPEVIKLIIESERQWCGSCKKEINAREEKTLPFTEYGINTFMMVMILRHRAHCSFATISQVISIGYGLNLSNSDISNLLKKAGSFLGKKYEELKQSVRDGAIIYLDETGWQVRGKSAWMWIMASETETVYVAAESRGKGIAEEMYGGSNALAMTDGYGSYTNTIPKDRHLYCWAHVLRFAHEETVDSTKGSDSIHLREELIRIYQIKFEHPEYSKDQLEQILTQEFDQLGCLESNETSFQNILARIKYQMQGLIKALLETKSGTNNLAERELRPVALQRKVSFGSDTYQGMETTAIVCSVIQTFGRDKQKSLLPQLKQTVQQAVKDRYWQYNHIPFSSA